MWPSRLEEEEIVSPLAVVDHRLPMNATEESILHTNIMIWLNSNYDQVIILMVVLILTLKFILFEDKEEHPLMRGDFDLDGACESFLFVLLSIKSWACVLIDFFFAFQVRGI